MLVIENIFINS